MPTPTTNPQIEVPTPLPHHRGRPSIPPSLRQEILTALADNDSIPVIQAGMDEALAPMLQLMVGLVEGILEVGEGDGTEMDDGEVLRRVLAAVVVGDVETETDAEAEAREAEAREAEAREADGTLQIRISEGVIATITQSVRREIEGVTRCVDGEGWLG